MGDNLLTMRPQGQTARSASYRRLASLACAPNGLALGPACKIGLPDMTFQAAFTIPSAIKVDHDTN